MDGIAIPEPDYPAYVEVDPSGRYGRYNEILGKGASKTVYRAFDEYDGIEVAWNQVKLYDFLQSPEELERLYREIHLLKTLKHKNIMKFCTSWVDSANRNINFVTEMFTSGTLRQYRLKHKRVNIRAVKHWCRQILEGLLYLHSHDPPVIHRDLKCDNIFINGNQGEVKIGDLGLAAILRKAHAVRCVGTPEFMAPEVYEEEYNELVDIYSFGMCVLEMVTFEYPYSECTHPAQIYKKVVSGKKPEALYKLKDPEVRQFVEKCLATVSSRLSARELLKDPFLEIDDNGYDLRPVDYYGEFDVVNTNPYLTKPSHEIDYKNCSSMNGYTNDIGYGPLNDWDYDSFEFERSESDLFTSQEDHMDDAGVTIEGRRQDDDGIFLRLRVADKEGRIRNIYFPFDLETDTALSVATEMVAELEMTDQDVIKIADMIDDELASLVPEWKKGLGIEETQESSHNTDTSFCHNCASNGSLVDNGSSFCHNCASNGSQVDHVSSKGTGAENLQVLSYSNNECASIHGRFEEIMYQVEGPGQGAGGGNESIKFNESNKLSGMQYADIWAQREGRPESSSNGLGEIRCSEVHDIVGESSLEEEGKALNNDKQDKGMSRKSARSHGSIARPKLDDYENEIRQELRWLKAKYQMQLRELKDQQLGIKLLSSGLSQDSSNSEQKKVNSESSTSDEQETKNESFLDFISFRKRFISHFPLAVNKASGSADKDGCPEVSNSSCNNKEMVTMNSFYAGALPTHPLHRAASLPVDSVDV